MNFFSSSHQSTRLSPSPPSSQGSMNKRFDGCIPDLVQGDDLPLSDSNDIIPGESIRARVEYLYLWHMHTVQLYFKDRPDDLLVFYITAETAEEQLDRFLNYSQPLEKCWGQQNARQDVSRKGSQDSKTFSSRL